MEAFFNKEYATMAYAYLRECGIIGKLNEIFGKLLEAERPDLINFIREELGDKPTPTEIVENMEQELDDAHREIRRLRGILKELGVNITDEQVYEADPGPGDIELFIDLDEINDDHTVGQHTQQTN